MAITYRELSRMIGRMPMDRLDDHVTIFNGENTECYAATEFGPIELIDKNDDAGGALDDGHLVIGINTPT